MPLETIADACHSSVSAMERSNDKDRFSLKTTGKRYDGNTARLARRSDEALEVRVSVTRIAPSLLDLGHGVPTRYICRGQRNGVTCQQNFGMPSANQDIASWQPSQLGTVRSMLVNRVIQNIRLITSEVDAPDPISVIQLIDRLLNSTGFCDFESRCDRGLKGRPGQFSRDRLSQSAYGKHTSVQRARGQPTLLVVARKSSFPLHSFSTFYPTSLHTWLVALFGAEGDARKRRARGKEIGTIERPLCVLAQRTEISNRVCYGATGATRLQQRRRRYCGDRAVSLLASHQYEPVSIPGLVTPRFSHTGIVPDDAAGRWVFSVTSRFPLLLHSSVSSFSLLTSIKTSLLRAAQISSHVHSFLYFTVLSRRPLPCQRYYRAVVPRLGSGTNWRKSERIGETMPAPDTAGPSRTSPTTALIRASWGPLMKSLVTSCSATNPALRQHLVQVSVTFYTNGKVNRHNVRIWGQEHPHDTTEHERASPKMNMFCTAFKPYFRPFLFSQAHSYWNSLFGHAHRLVVSSVRRGGRGLRFSAGWCVTPLSCSRISERDVAAMLALHQWTPRSPDLTPCYFFYRVFCLPLPANIDDQKTRITDAVQTVTPGMLKRVSNEFEYRVNFVRVTHGHIEHL
ncbi:hypothetical protein PR048_019849 [Dryococelus australis]|uniref:Uncharacterized protein n=1 Tax=Dryococelus australis TaxID=614101 RepID=A0ABQ9H4L3_9NEOP|nr:hypothetical protein PR048_019849 [Dryococelus australis]